MKDLDDNYIFKGLPMDDDKFKREVMKFWTAPEKAITFFTDTVDEKIRVDIQNKVAQAGTRLKNEALHLMLDIFRSFVDTSYAPKYADTNLQMTIPSWHLHPLQADTPN